MLHLMCQREREMEKKTEHKNVWGLVVRCITGASFHLIRNLLCETEHDRLKNTSCVDFLWDVRKRCHWGKQTQLRQNHTFRATDRKWHAQVCLPWPQKRQSRMSAICRWSSETSVWLLPSIYQPACWSMQPQTGITKIKKTCSDDQNFNFQIPDCTL